MQSILYLKIWCVPLVNPVVSEELIVGTRRLAEVAAIRKLNDMSPHPEYWVSLIEGNVYMYGVAVTWLGVMSIADVGYAPGKREDLSEVENDGR